jgi:hypothetical protein
VDGDTTEESDGGECRVAPNGKVTLVVGNESATVDLSESVDFTVQVADNEPLVGETAERRLEFALEWDAGTVDTDDSLEIE